MKYFMLNISFTIMNKDTDYEKFHNKTNLIDTTLCNNEENTLLQIIYSIIEKNPIKFDCLYW